MRGEELVSWGKIWTSLSVEYVSSVELDGRHTEMGQTAKSYDLNGD